MKPDFAQLAADLAHAFRRAATDRLMHEDGCPEGEQIKAGIAAIAPAIYRAGLERGAEIAGSIGTRDDHPLWVAHSLYDNMRKHVAAAIREEKEKHSED